MTASNHTLLTEAISFITQMYNELDRSQADLRARIEHIQQDIHERGMYTHTSDELEYGAKLAWRNSNRCIGRLFWQSLTVIDRRDVKTAEEGREALFQHIRFATNGGKIRPTITILGEDTREHAGLRIYNDQLMRYAGYETENGVIGDPLSIPLTTMAMELGWKGAASRFDILPLLIQESGQAPRWFDIPKEIVLEVPLSHPDYEWFEALELRWYAVPIVSNMKLEIGGITYHAAPFNGWYMGTEIGARNLADSFRYNLLPTIAEKLGLSTTSNLNLWKDKALIELNVAVLHSYKQQGVSIVDHHTAAQQYMQFERLEQEQGRQVTGDWSWLIPPMSPAATPIFHQEYDNTWLKPNFFYKEKAQ